jgi:MFS family permease
VLRAARTVAVTLAAQPARARRWPAALAWALAGLTVLTLIVGFWLAELVWSTGWEPRPSNTIAIVGAIILVAVSAATVGAFLAGRRPRHPVGWLLLGVGLALNVSLLVQSYVKYGLLARPGSLPGVRYLAGFADSTALLWVSCAGFVLLLTPTGSLPSRRWRWWARLAAVAPVVIVVGSVVQPDPLAPDYHGNPLAVPALARVLVVPAVAGVVVVAVALLVGAGSLVGRFRRARGVERQQLRWLAYAAGLAAGLLLVALFAGFLLAKDEVVVVSLALGVALLPLATGAAILRYRLYDLDRIISRTLAYGLLTVLLGGGYAGVVLGLGQLLGRDSSLVVAVATLAVAAVFQPARRRIQQAVDRRFNRRRYDAARTIAAFSARLRQQVDLDTLTAELLGVVEQTMQPTSASLWLRPSVSASAEQRSMGASRAASPPAVASPFAATGL